MNGVFYFGISSFVPEIFRFFFQNLMMSQIVHMTTINHKIENILEGCCSNLAAVIYGK